MTKRKVKPLVYDESNPTKKFEMVPVNKLIPFAMNSAKHSDQQIDALCKSIKLNGFNTTLTIDENNIILCGHGRLMALKKLNYKMAPCFRITGLNEAQKHSYNVGDNIISEMRGKDNDMLANQLQAIKELVPDLSAMSDMTSLDVPTIEAYLARDGEEKKENKATRVNSFRVIIACSNASEQKRVFDDLAKSGYKATMK